MFTLKTGTAEHYQDPESGETRLVVPFDIVDEAGTVVHSMKESFELSATAEAIKEVLQRHVTVYTEDSARHEVAKEAQAKVEASAAEAAKISNITL